MFERRTTFECGRYEVKIDQDGDIVIRDTRQDEHFYIVPPDQESVIAAMKAAIEEAEGECPDPNER